MKATVVVRGCDDFTKVVVDVEEFELDVLKRIAEKVTATSTSGCMPRMFVYDGEVVLTPWGDLKTEEHDWLDE